MNPIGKGPASTLPQGAPPVRHYLQFSDFTAEEYAFQIAGPGLEFDDFVPLRHSGNFNCNSRKRPKKMSFFQYLIAGSQMMSMIAGGFLKKLHQD